MVRGIDKFREFFTGYEGNYVIIGGTACEMHEEIYAQTPRATKDIDIILIVEALSSDFAAKFWEFVKTAGYRQRNKGTGNGECRHEYYRFKEPGNPDFPYQIELFSRNIGVVKFPDDPLEIQLEVFRAAYQYVIAAFCGPIIIQSLG